MCLQYLVMQRTVLQLIIHTFVRITETSQSYKIFTQITTICNFTGIHRTSFIIAQGCVASRVIESRRTTASNCVEMCSFQVHGNARNCGPQMRGNARNRGFAWGGRECHIPGITTTAPSAIQTLREASLPIKGPRLFNCLPQHIRNASGCTTEAFKCMLDKYLKTVPDEPHIPGLTQYRRCESNSITDWTRHPAQHVEPMLDDERHDQDLAAHRGSRIATSWGPSPRTPPSDYRVSDMRVAWMPLNRGLSAGDVNGKLAVSAAQVRGLVGPIFIRDRHVKG